ncbi:AMIN domain-containing protein [Nostoc sp.]|uniref:AMIN domain-containing protein n=1 Tax=Nostoc sp. TaxID=1180 RepID=UPI002FF9CF52
MLLSSPARATRLESWHFDPNQNQLDLTTDSGIQPRVFLIDNPKRLVIDLSGTTLSYPTTKQNFGSKIREIRVSQLDPQTTRLVIELAPGYTVSPQSVIVRRDSNFHWVVKLSSIEKMPATGIFVRRPYNDIRGRDFIRQVSQLVYTYLDQPKLTQLP